MTSCACTGRWISGHRSQRTPAGRNSDGSNADPNQPSEIVEFTKGGVFVTQFSVDANLGGEFGLALQNIGGGTRFAAVDDNRLTLPPRLFCELRPRQLAGRSSQQLLPGGRGLEWALAFTAIHRAATASERSTDEFG